MGLRLTRDCRVPQYFGIDIGILFWKSRYWYWYWYLFWKSQVLVLVLVSFLKISSIGIVIGIEFANLKYWYRYWYRLFVLKDKISVSFKTSRYCASMVEIIKEARPAKRIRRQFELTPKKLSMAWYNSLHTNKDLLPFWWIPHKIRLVVNHHWWFNKMHLIVGVNSAPQSRCFSILSCSTLITESISCSTIFFLQMEGHKQNQT